MVRKFFVGVFVFVFFSFFRVEFFIIFFINGFFYVEDRIKGELAENGGVL